MNTVHVPVVVLNLHLNEYCTCPCRTTLSVYLGVLYLYLYEYCTCPCIGPCYRWPPCPYHPLPAHPLSSGHHLNIETNGQGASYLCKVCILLKCMLIYWSPCKVTRKSSKEERKNNKYAKVCKCMPNNVNSLNNWIVWKRLHCTRAKSKTSCIYDVNIQRSDVSQCNNVTVIYVIRFWAVKCFTQRDWFPRCIVFTIFWRQFLPGEFYFMIMLRRSQEQGWGTHFLKLTMTYGLYVSVSCF